MLKLTNETKVGLLATVAIVIVILGINFLKGKNIFSQNVILYAYYPAVDGLNPSNPVTLYGLKIGQVDEVVLQKRGHDNIKVVFHIKGDVKIPENTVAKIVNSSLLGSKQIELVPGNSQQYAKRYDTLYGEVELSLSESISQVVAPVKDKVENLISSVDTIVTALNEVFNDDTKRDLRTSFKSIRSSLQNVEKTSNQVNEFITNETTHMRNILRSIDHITTQLDKSGPQIQAAINNFAAISDSLRAANLKHTMLELNKSVTTFNGIIQKVNNGEGSIGKLLNDESLYNSLDKASSDLDKLILDLKANPGKYVNISLFNFGGSKNKKTE